MKTIKFAENYNNKLNCKVFTTIRDATKDLPYRKDEVEVEGPDGSFRAEVIDFSTYDRLNAVPEPILFPDTGKKFIREVAPLFNSFGIQPRSPVVVLTLRKLEEE